MGTIYPNKKDKFLKWKGKGVRCYYYQKMSHIKRHYRHYKSDHKKRLKENKTIEQPIWVEKGKTKSLVVFTSLKVETKQRWYLDIGSSRNMIGNKWSLSNVLPSSLDLVTFKDGAKGSVLRSRSLNVPGLPKLRDVLLVNGLKANLINFSQLCDQDLFVKFTKDKCIVIDQDRQRIMEGNRLSNNCYLLEISNTCQNII